MTSGEVVYSLSDYAKEFVRKYKNPKLDQKVIDAIVVDFVNYFAAMHCGIDLAMYTSDLRTEKRLRGEGTVLRKEIIIPALSSRKNEYSNLGIIKSVNRNRYMNECNGKAKANNKEAVKLIEEFIKGYMAA